MISYKELDTRKITMFMFPGAIVIKNAVPYAPFPLSSMSSVSVHRLIRETTEEMDYVSNPKLYFE